MRAMRKGNKLTNNHVVNTDETTVQRSSRDNFNTPSTSRSANTHQLAVVRHHVKDACNNNVLINTRKRSRSTSDDDLIERQIELLRHVTEDEQLYRRKQFEVITHVLNIRLHCTACDVHIGYHHGQNTKALSHPFLKVLCCLKCVTTIRKAELPLSIYKQEKYCWWCAKPEREVMPLRCCSSCPLTFCYKCLKQNLGLNNLGSSNVWFCPACDVSKVWRLRGVYCALLRISKLKRCANPQQKGDVSKCCFKSNTQTEVGSGQSSSHDEIAAVPDIFAPKAIFVRDLKDMTRGSERSNEHGEQIIKQNLPHIDSLNKKINTTKLKIKLNQICAYTAMLNSNAFKLLEGLSDDDDDDNGKIENRLGILTSLLTMGSNQFPTFIKEVQSLCKN